MTIVKKRITIFCGALVTIVLLLFVVISFNGFRREHTVFDSQKWKTDIASRYDMPEPARPGMHKAEILELLGNPDAVGSDKKDPSLFYLMPTASKGIYCVYFKNDIVVSTHYDDSADDSYPGQNTP